MTRYKWTQQHEDAAQRWVKELGCPSLAHRAVIQKMKRRRLTPDQIINDLEFLKSRLQSKEQS